MAKAAGEAKKNRDLGPYQEAQTPESAEQA